MTQDAKFKIGDQVKYIGPDTSGKVMTVEGVRLIKCNSIPSYYRIQAGWYISPFDAGMCEARENLFAAVQ